MAKGVDWNKIGQERVSRELRKEMRKPLNERYKVKVSNHAMETSIGSTKTLKSLGDGGFERQNITLNDYQ